MPTHENGILAVGIFVTLKLINPGPSEAGWHRLEDAITCPRKFALHNAPDAVKTSSDAQARGTLVHIALAHHYANAAGAVDYYNPEDAMRQVAETNGGMWPEIAESLQNFPGAYAARWGREDFKVVGIEKVLKTQINVDGEDFLYTQRADLIVNVQGKIYIFDHKTTYALTTKVSKKYSLSGQIHGYHWLGRRLWQDNYGGVVLNYLIRPSAKTSWLFERPHLAPAPAINFETTLTDGYRRIKELRSRYGADPDAYPQALNEACYGTYGPCEFFDRCSWGKP